MTSKTSHDTTTCLAADRWGNVVAATPSGWSGVQAGRTGVWLGSRLISFNTWPGHPNCIEPGKRPRITLTPTLVLKAGKPVLAVSVAGGDTQDQATLQMIRDLRHASARSFCRSDRNRRIPDRERHKPAPR